MQSKTASRILRDDLRALASDQESIPSLPAVPYMGEQPRQRGVADYEVAGQAKGVISGDLVETDYTKRTYYEDSVVLDTTLLMGVEIKPVKNIEMESDGEKVNLTFAEPVKEG